MDFLLELLFSTRYFVGFIQNGVFPQKLTDEEEQKALQDLFQEETHQDARVRLIEHNLRLVAHIAKKYESADELNEDLISIGTLGLIKAVDTYSPDKEVKLATYAAKCIENEILMTLRGSKRSLHSVSLFEAIGTDKDGSEITLMDVYPSEEKSVSEDLEKEHNIASLLKYLQVLDDRELEILSLRYGLRKEKEHTQREIAKMYGISRSYVSRIEKRALTKLLQEFKKNERNQKNLL